jgi:hypothetical protein
LFRQWYLERVAVQEQWSDWEAESRQRSKVQGGGVRQRLGGWVSRDKRKHMEAGVWVEPGVCKVTSVFFPTPGQGWLRGAELPPRWNPPD